MSELSHGRSIRDDSAVSDVEEQRRRDTSRQEAVGRISRADWPADDGWICNCIVLRDNMLLLLKREEDGYMGGSWDLPGGKLDDREDPVEAARRELEEEAGLIGETLVEVAHYSNEDAYGDKSRFHTVTFEVTQEDSTRAVQLSDEHPEFCWVDSAQFRELPVVWYVRRVIEQHPWYIAEQ